VEPAELTARAASPLVLGSGTGDHSSDKETMTAIRRDTAHRALSNASSIDEKRPVSCAAAAEHFGQARHNPQRRNQDPGRDARPNADPSSVADGIPVSDSQKGNF
jgi:hypothetical protein